MRWARCIPLVNNSRLSSTARLGPWARRVQRRSFRCRVLPAGLRQPLSQLIQRVTRKIAPRFGGSEFFPWPRVCRGRCFMEAVQSLECPQASSQCLTEVCHGRPSSLRALDSQVGPQFDPRCVLGRRGFCQLCRERRQFGAPRCPP